MVEQLNVKLPSPESTYPNGMPDKEGEPLAREVFGEQIRTRMRKGAVKIGSLINNNPVPYFMSYFDEHGNMGKLEIDLYPISKKQRDAIYERHDSIVIFLQPVLAAEIDDIADYFNNLGLIDLANNYKKVRDEIKSAKILASANIDWQDEAGNVVWSQEDTKKRNKAAAYEAIDRLPAGEVEDMVRRIDEISGFLDEKERAMLQKK